MYLVRKLGHDEAIANLTIQQCPIIFEADSIFQAERWMIDQGYKFRPCTNLFSGYYWNPKSGPGYGDTFYLDIKTS